MEFYFTFKYVVPELLHSRLVHLNIHSSTCQWITFFLFIFLLKKQYVQLGLPALRFHSSQHRSTSGLCFLTKPQYSVYIIDYNRTEIH